ncbi:hypothetical protein LINPERPRIM_LOCUS35722, partial [Linum perenne]
KDLIFSPNSRILSSAYLHHCSRILSSSSYLHLRALWAKSNATEPTQILRRPWPSSTTIICR